MVDRTAAVWVVRLHSPTLREGEIVALCAWLDASDLHLHAYRRAWSVWNQLPARAAQPERQRPTAH